MENESKPVIYLVYSEEAAKESGYLSITVEDEPVKFTFGCFDRSQIENYPHADKKLVRTTALLPQQYTHHPSETAEARSMASW